MNILVLSHEYPPIGGGGGQVVADVSRQLAIRGHSLHVITTHFGDLPEFEKQGNLVIERIPSFRTQSFRAGFPAMACFILQSVRYGLRAVRLFQPALIHAHFAVPAGFAALCLSRLTHRPYFITTHGGDVPGGAPQKTDRWFRFVLPFTKTIWRNASAVISVSQQTRRFAQKHYPVDIKVIPNGIDLQAYQPGTFDPKKSARILFVGRFSPEKNAIAVPRILSRLKDLKWECVMLGDGLQMGEVKRAIADSEMTERFQLKGWVTPAEVLQCMQASDILLMPSLLDSMPVTGLHALAMGLALVVSDIGSCADFINSETNGFLVSPGDLDGYAAALRKLISNKKILRATRSASRRHARSFDLRSAIDSYEETIAQVTKGK